MFAILPSLLLFFAFVPLALSWSVNGTIVNLDYASYNGVYNASGNTTYFLGVRYAAPPVGYLRFQAPTKPTRQDGVQQANTEPPQCWQSTMGESLSEAYTKRQATGVQLPPSANVSQDEDCLFLDIWTPGKPNPKAKLPVIVWIHGGGYARGSMATFNGWEIVKNGQYEVVVVEMQYRLGIFGFLAGKEIKEKAALNAGILDQDFALQWVQEYIYLFGGDPGKVTIWGESAGAGSVLQHVVAHGGQDNRNLFKAAITSSVFLPFQYSYDHRIPEEFYSTVANLSGCGNANNTFGCLQSADISVLQVANYNSSYAAFYGTWFPVPVVDGEFITERPLETLNKGLGNGEKLYAVNNALEGSIFVEEAAANGTLTEYVQNFAPTLNSSQVDSVVSAYSNLTGLNTTYDQAIAIMGECIFICPSYFLFNAFPGKAYRGWLAIPPANHAEDINYYFQDGQAHGPRAYNNTQFLASFAESFTSLAKSIDVNDHDDPDNITPHWDLWSNNHTEMLFNTTNVTDSGQPIIKPFSTDQGLLDRCALWNSLGPYLEY